MQFSGLRGFRATEPRPCGKPNAKIVAKPARGISACSDLSGPFEPVLRRRKVPPPIIARERSGRVSEAKASAMPGQGASDEVFRLRARVACGAACVQHGLTRM